MSEVINKNEGQDTTVITEQAPSVGDNKKEQSQLPELANSSDSNKPNSVEAAKDANKEESNTKEESNMKDDPNQPKKKKNKKKKKNQIKGTQLTICRCIGGFCDEYTCHGQSNPPSRPVRQIYNDNYPLGEISEYTGDNNRSRITSEEKKALERTYESTYKDFRKAAIVHKQVRKYAQTILKPGINLYDFCCDIEDKCRLLIEEKGLESGLSFPCGVSLNNIAAHYTPNPWDDPVFLNENDVMKLDFGTQINGNIIDCALTVAFNPRYDPLLLAVKESTNVGIRLAGIDARLDEIGASIQECMESHEVEINGTVYPIKSVSNLSGHSLGRYTIHAGKTVPLVKGSHPAKMEEGEYYAIETFGSTGQGFVNDTGETSHYMMDTEALQTNLRLKTARLVYNHIKKTFSTMAFCPRWLDRPDGGSKFINKDGGKIPGYRAGLHSLVENGLVRPYPPLADQRGSYVAQWEHTILLKPTCKEVVSRGDDY